MKLLACGSNAKGQLAVSDDSDRSTFTPCSFASCPAGELPSATSILQVAFGANHTILLCENTTGTQSERSIWGVGDGSRGQLGLRRPAAAAFTFTFNKLDIRCSGFSPRGRSIVHIAACWETSFVVFRPLDETSASDVCASMGANDFGDLGVAPAQASSKRSLVLPPSSSTPAAVSFAYAIHESGIQPTSDPLPIIRITQIATGLHHVLAVLHLILSNGITREILVGWGASRNGQLELHDFASDTAHTSSSSPFPSTSTPRSRKTNGGATFTQYPRHIYTVPPGERIVSLGLGQHHSVVLVQDDLGGSRFLCGGSNRKGQLDLRSYITGNAIPHSVACTWNGTFVEYGSSSGSEGRFQIAATGSRERGQLGRQSDAPTGSVSGLQPVQFPSSISQRPLSLFASGSEHALAVVEIPSPDIQPTRSEVWGWGWNEHGNLGLGHTDDVPVPTRLWPPSDTEGPASDSSPARKIRGVWAGNGTSWLFVD